MSSPARVGRHELVGQGVLVADVVAVHSLATDAALATWFGSPATKHLLPVGTKQNAVARVWASPVGGSVVLFLACKLAVPNAELSGLTEWAGDGGGG